MAGAGAGQPTVLSVVVLVVCAIEALIVLHVHQEAHHVDLHKHTRAHTHIISATLPRKHGPRKISLRRQSPRLHGGYRCRLRGRHHSRRAGMGAPRVWSSMLSTHVPSSLCAKSTVNRQHAKDTRASGDLLGADMRVVATTRRQSRHIEHACMIERTHAVVRHRPLARRMWG